jgi:hypothetical protein
MKFATSFFLTSVFAMGRFNAIYWYHRSKAVNADFSGAELSVSDT